MTAEIAILNRTAVALAADSVVTLAGDDQKRKTYDSAEKIFQLSRFQPIGLMIYNNALFMNAPLEVLIRKFRETITSKGFDELVQVWPSFEKYLLEFKRSEEDEMEHFRIMLAAELKLLRDAAVTHRINLQGKAKKGAEKPEELVARKILERTVEAEKRPLDPPFLNDIDFAQFDELFGEQIGLSGKERFTPVSIEHTEELRESISRMMLAILRSDIRSSAYTGFVFAGFGSQEVFPTLDSIEVDGIYFGRLRTMNRKFVDIDRRGETAAILPFAEKEMADRFIYGFDSGTEQALTSITASVVGDVVGQCSNELGEEKTALVLESASRQIEQSMTELRKNAVDKLKSVVKFLSKKELAEVAFLLVELTSRKKRYSPDVETVGGPIDIAVLTRNEGFIWVKRKHYFDVALNPQYTPR